MKLPIAVQLYSLRREMEHDFVGILEKVAGLGLDGVEFAGFGGLSARELKGHLDRLGLKAVCTHTNADLLTNDYEATVAYHKEIGCKNIAIPYYDLPDEDAAKRAAELFAQLSEKLSADEIALHYHNHDQEFKRQAGGMSVMEYLLAHGGLSPEIDTYWAHEAGVSPSAFIREHRPSLIHLKDGNGGHELTAVGDGKNDIAGILDAAVESGVQWIIIENDDPKPDGVSDLARSMDNLKNKFHF